MRLSDRIIVVFFYSVTFERKVMPLIQTIQDGDAKVGIWLITEPEAFFTGKLPHAIAGVPGVHHPVRRLQHLAARYLLTEIAPDFPLGEVRIAPSGKPVLPGDAFHFSLAHSGNRAAAIVSRSRSAGIDIEKVTPRITRVASRFLAPGELAFLDAARRQEALTICWNAKEAVYKWFGRPGVAFRGDMRLDPFALSGCGQLSCHFSPPPGSAAVRLTLPYILDDGFGLAWLLHAPAGNTGG
jgi:phosphopantetheinyl transferase (holo-ACP synthase)